MAKAAGIGDVRLALVITGILAGYILLALSRPLIRCPRCLGKRVVRPKGKKGKPRRPRKCRLCDGHGIYRLPAAIAIHRFYWTVFGDHIAEHQKAAVAKRVAAEPPKEKTP